MPSVVIAASVSSPWRDGATVAASVSSPWRDGAEISTIGSPFVPPAAPPGSTPSVPSLAPDTVLNVTNLTSTVHTVAVVDLRDNAVLQFDSMSIATDAGSVCWTLNASAPAEAFDRFTADGDLPVISVTIDGMVWRFLVEGVSRSRDFGSTNVSITGRSITITAGDPYQFPVNWINEGPASAAQLADQAQLYTQMEVVWGLDDWLVPDRVWTFTGTPLSVVKRVAESVAAVVVSDRAEFRVSVLPRYRVLPNEWPTVPPDVEIHLAAVVTDSYTRADQPAYNGVYVSGQQQGVVGHVYLEGTLGDKLAPMVSDLLLTDTAAARQRGVAILGASGPQATVQMTLPVLVGAGLPGVLALGAICHVVDAGTLSWWGMVRSVSVSVSLPSVSQTVTLERHTAALTGTTILLPP